MPNRNVNINNGRLISVDLVRFLAIFLMFADHSVKLFYDFTPTINTGSIHAYIAMNILLTTTFSAPLFLFLVGVSSILSFTKKGHEDNWLMDKIKRGFFYGMISFPLFFYQEGMSEIPYTSGVLQLIGISLIIVSILLVYIMKKRSILFFSLTVGVLIVDAILKSRGIHVPVLTKINFPILPYIAYVFAGSFMAENLINASKNTDIIKKIGIISSISVLFFLFLSGLDPLFISATYTVVEGYIIHSTLMVVYYISLMTLFLVGLLMIEKFLKRSSIVKQFALIGREALNIYILHIILGWGVSKYILNDQKFGFWAPVLAVFIFTVLGWIWAKARRNGYFQFMP